MPIPHNEVAGLQLIRKPGKEGRVINGQHRCYVVWAEQGVYKEYLLDGPADILGLDLGAPLGDVAKQQLDVVVWVDQFDALVLLARPICGRNADGNVLCRHVLGDDRVCADSGALTDGDGA